MTWPPLYKTFVPFQKIIIQTNILTFINKLSKISPQSKEFFVVGESHVDSVRLLKNRERKYNGYGVRDTYFFPYCLDVIALSLHSLYTIIYPMDAIYKLIKFLDDADLTGSIIGQIVGDFYGGDKLDQRVVSWVHQWSNKEIEFQGVILCQLGVSVSKLVEKLYVSTIVY